MGENIINGLINTVIGMGTVFLVLIFISFVISLFIYIPKLEAKFTGKKKEPEVKQAEPSHSVQVEEEEEEELVDDTELVAVITAAIMASMGDEAPSDGLVVRSIRKVNKSKWQTV